MIEAILPVARQNTRFYRDFEIPLLTCKRKRQRKLASSHESDSIQNVQKLLSSESTKSLNELENGTDEAVLDCEIVNKINYSNLRYQLSKVFVLGAKTRSLENLQKKIIPNLMLASKELIVRLTELENNEASLNYDISALYNIDPEICDKVNGQMRDDAVRKLLSLHKAFFDLSPKSLCQAVFIIDQFIMRVRVKPKYMSCVTTAAYHIACEQHELPEKRPLIEELVNLTRCGGTEEDLKRMATIIKNKLPKIDGTTHMDYLEFFFDVLNQIANKSLNVEYQFRAIKRLLCALTHFSLRQYSTPCLALSTICLDDEIVSDSAYQFGLGQILDVLNLTPDEVYFCSQAVDAVFIRSYQPGFPACINQLFWCLSRRTRHHISSSKDSKRRLTIFAAIPETSQTCDQL